MEQDYREIGRRVARRRRELGLKQAQVAEVVGISNNHMSAIERARSIPSVEVVIRLAVALDTTPDEFLVGTLHQKDREEWRQTAELLRGLDGRQLALAARFLAWLREQKL